jgi:ketosteroid isomerase-like protein
MDRKELARLNREPFDNLGIAKKYFAAVKTMDRAATRGRDFGTDKILALWSADGKLTIGGKQFGEDRSYTGLKEIDGFYRHRARGVDGAFALNHSTVDVANAKSADHVTASGQRYVVTANDEGLQVPFTHNFTMRDGKITELRIHVGVPGKTSIAPLGALQVEDMGRLSAMAWMVA